MAYLCTAMEKQKRENALKKTLLFQGIFYVSHVRNVGFPFGKRTVLGAETYVSG